ncbi:MAG: helix-turn-helix transcriptional regulator [Deltaproteobacteria bacterium]|nr:helix-turn-helix transcriptional regulator [Deltaproteobacteria bacterium]MBW1991726.1 helix-turn-helix transcriptional regulator [Deltaproteobacteria bacterium]
MPRRRRPKDPNHIIDLRKLKEFRQRAGLTMKQVEEAIGIRASNLCDFERGRMMLQLHHLMELLRLYDLDIFEAHEVLRLRLLDAKLLRDFRKACARHGTSPAEALNDFMIVFTQLE